MKKVRDIKVTVICSPGWEERVSKAFYELYKRMKSYERRLPQSNEKCSVICDFMY
ncbi:MAG: hypothetical protein GXX10_01790 [Clostridiaceae bacterium]|nr:hypothetical protein [Clostridiaceae bacterium]